MVDADDLRPVSYIDGRVAVAVAAFVGDTRLIDNIVFDLPADGRRNDIGRPPGST